MPRGAEQAAKNEEGTEEQVLFEGNNRKETYVERENGMSPRTKTLERTGTR
jgi:hypothetical protein